MDPKPTVEQLDVVDRREAWVVSTLVATTLIVYSACLILNYYLEDEQWVMNFTRSPDAKWVFAQGRPVFWLFLSLTGLLRNTAGEHTMVILRLCAILCLAGAGWIFTWWFRRCSCSTLESTALAVAVVTLPGFQIYIGNAVWFTAPLLLVAALPLLIWKLNETAGYRRLVGIAAAAASALVVLSFYQPILLIVFGLSVLPIALIDPRDEPLVRRRLRYAMTTLVGTAICTLLYFVVWRALYVHYLPDSVGAHYSPAIVSKPSERAWFFVSNRLKQALNLWTLDVGWIRVTGVLVLAAIVGGIIVDVAKCYSAGQLREIGRAAWWAALKYGTLGALVVGADAIPLLSRDPVGSYSTVAALSLALFLWAVGATLSTLQAFRWRNWGTVGLLALAVYGAGVATFTVTAYIAWPLHLEYELVASDVRSYLAVHPGPVHRIHVIGRPDKLFNKGPAEFAWSNLTIDSYSIGLLRNVLRDLGTNAAAGFRHNSDYWDFIPATHSGPFAATTELQRAWPRSADVLVVDTRRYPSEHGGVRHALERHNPRIEGISRGRLAGQIARQADGAIEVGTSGFVLHDERLADEDLPLNVYTWPVDFTEADLNSELQPLTDAVQWRASSGEDIVTELHQGFIAVDGVPKNPKSYLLTWRERPQIGTCLIVRGRLEEGGFQLGFVHRGRWAGSVKQTEPGSFLIILQVQETDEYQLVLANWIESPQSGHGKGRNRFVISSAGWLRPAD